MRAVIQRVSSASVSVESRILSEIKTGMVVLLGVHENDSPDDAEYLADKVAGLRIFEDEQGKMNLSSAQVNGEILAISQFTLYSDTRKGRRPGFSSAARPEKAEPLYENFMTALRERSIPVHRGQFGAMMRVSINNDGPVTIIIDSEDRHKPRR
ncbi:MAG: D-aminoacyl-tRNA deacylase [Calditrichia bacterium]